MRKKLVTDRTNVEQFLLFLFYQSIYPCFNYDTTAHVSPYEMGIFYLHMSHNCNFLFLHQKFLPFSFPRGRFYARDKKTWSAGLYGKRGVLTYCR